MWFGKHSVISKLSEANRGLDSGTISISPCEVVRDLGVLLDSELTMKLHVSKLAAACFYQLRRIRQIRRIINQEVAAQMVHALVISKLDYCNGALQRVQNAAARLVLNLKLSDHVTPALN